MAPETGVQYYVESYQRLKMVLDTFLLNTFYKVRTKGVAANEKGAFVSPSTTFANFTLCIYMFVYVSSIYIFIYIRGSLNTFPDFFRMATFIDSTHIKF